LKHCLRLRYSRRICGEEEEEEEEEERALKQLWHGYSNIYCV
jgi:hypothetical protein